MTPTVAELLEAAHVVSLPLVTRFRDIDAREAILLQGPHGWSEFSPFVEYGDAEAATWLAAAIEFGWGATPPAVRDSIPVNATLPDCLPVRRARARIRRWRNGAARRPDVGLVLALVGGRNLRIEG